MKYNKTVLTIAILLVIAFIFVGCGVIPTPTQPKGTISGQVLIPPDASSLSRDITGWVPAASATVTVVDANGVTHTVTTDENGYYTFENVAVNPNTVVTASVMVNGKTVVLKSVIPQSVAEDEDYDAGTMTPESTTLALVVEKLIAEGVDPDDIDLAEVQASDSFTALVEQVTTVIEEEGNVTEDPDVTDGAGNTADEIINPPTPPSEPSGPSTVSVTGVTLDKETLTLTAGETTTLTATIAPENATNKNITWESSDEAIVTVADGVVTAVSNGIAIITTTSAADNSKTATCIVKVIDGWSEATNTSWYNEADVLFTINTADELSGLAKLVNEGNTFSGKTIVLGTDIDLLNIEWTPIGNSSDNVFSGMFEGNNKTISNMVFYFDDTDNYYGLFGRVSGAMIQNINFVSAEVSGGAGLAVLCGYAGSSTIIDSITVDATSVVSNTGHASGICSVSQSNSTIKNCINEATVSSDGEWKAAAGIVYWSTGLIDNCENWGIITSSQKNAPAGGIAGYAVGGTITNCFNFGSISAATEGATHGHAAGIAAYTEDEVLITDCANSGIIDSDDTNNDDAFKRSAGGIVGHINAGKTTVQRCSNTGAITGYNYAGGIIGLCGSAASCDVNSCYNNGPIISRYGKNALESPSYASGIVGYTNNNNWELQDVSYCLNAGSVNNYASNGDALQVAYDATNSYYYLGNTAYDTSDNVYQGSADDLAAVLNSDPLSTLGFWGVVGDIVQPLTLP